MKECEPCRTERVTVPYGRRHVRPWLTVLASESGGCHLCALLCEGARFYRHLWSQYSDAELEVEFRSGWTSIKRPLIIRVLRITNDLVFAAAWLHDLEFFSTPKTPGWRCSLGPAEHIPRYSGSGKCIDKIRRWLSDCQKNHLRCQHKGSSNLPRRVLDVTPSRIHSDVALYESKGEPEPYIALSHCWGTLPLLATTRNNFREHTEGIKFSSLPKTFRDAVVLSRELGVRYLWIDSLCIIQDEEADWIAESAKMTSIYAGSCLTVAATRSPNAQVGIFSTREENHKLNAISADGSPVNYFVRTKLSHDQFVSSYAENMNLSDRFPLFSRAWCFQEKLVAARVLHFTDDEMVWDCRVGISCECSFLDEYMSDKSQYPDVFQSGWGEHDLLHNLATQWNNIAQEYSGRYRTLQRDILPAISGVARQIHHKSLGRYLAGTWENALPVSLLWTSNRAQLAKELWNHRPKSYQAPSWSWASVIGSIVYTHDESSDHVEWHTSIVSVDCTPKDINVYGEVTAGKLIVTSPVCSAIVQPIDIQSKTNTMLARGEKVQRFIVDTEEDARELSGREVICLRIRTENDVANRNATKSGLRRHVKRALVLVTSDGNTDLYRRVGIINMGAPEFFDGDVGSTVTII